MLEKINCDQRREISKLKEMITSIENDKKEWMNRYIAHSIKVHEHDEVEDLIKERDILNHAYKKEKEKKEELLKECCGHTPRFLKGSKSVNLIV